MTPTTIPEVEAPWIEWAGGECPVKGMLVHVEVRCRDGAEWTSVAKRELHGACFDWQHDDAPGDIIAYRLVASS